MLWQKPLSARASVCTCICLGGGWQPGTAYPGSCCFSLTWLLARSLLPHGNRRYTWSNWNIPVISRMSEFCIRNQCIFITVYASLILLCAATISSQGRQHHLAQHLQTVLYVFCVRRGDCEIYDNHNYLVYDRIILVISGTEAYDCRNHAQNFLENFGTSHVTV